MGIPIESDMALRVALPPLRPFIEEDEGLDLPHPPELTFGAGSEIRTIVETDPSERDGRTEFGSFGVSGNERLDFLHPLPLGRISEGPQRRRRASRGGKFERHVGPGVDSPGVPIAHRFDIGQPLDLAGCPLGGGEEEGDFTVSGGRAVKHDVVFGTNTPWITVSASLDLRPPLDLTSCPRFGSEDFRDTASFFDCSADHPELLLELCECLPEGKQN